MAFWSGSGGRKPKEALGLVQVMTVPGHHRLSSHRFREQGIYSWAIWEEKPAQVSGWRSGVIWVIWLMRRCPFLTWGAQEEGQSQLRVLSTSSHRDTQMETPRWGGQWAGSWREQSGLREELVVIGVCAWTGPGEVGRIGGQDGPWDTHIERWEEEEESEGAWGKNQNSGRDQSTGRGVNGRKTHVDGIWKGFLLRFGERKGG